MAGSHTARRRKSHFPSAAPVDQTVEHFKKHGFDYYDSPGGRIFVLAQEVATHAAKELTIMDVSIFKRERLLVAPTDATYDLEACVENALLEFDIEASCAVDSLPRWRKDLGRSIPDTFVYTFLR